MTLTIVSGAASGVEQGAIEAAVNLALRWQGWASEQNILTVAPVYRTGLQPTSATDPGMVRRLNIQGADGALVFSTSMVLVGVPAFVDRWTERMGRAFLHVTLNPALFGGAVWTAADGSKTDRRVVGPEVIAHVQRWIRDLPNGRVYVTGPSADDVPGIQGAVRDALIAILEPFAVDEVRETTRALSLIEQATSLAPQPPRCTCPPAYAPTTEHLAGCSAGAYYDGPTDCRGEPPGSSEITRALDESDEQMALTAREHRRALEMASNRSIGEREPPLDLGPATSADLLELDAGASNSYGAVAQNGRTPREGQARHGGCVEHSAANRVDVGGHTPTSLSLPEYGPATLADLAELDAVPEPVDSAEPAEVHLPGCRPIGPTAGTRPYRKPPTPGDQTA